MYDTRHPSLLFLPQLPPRNIRRKKKISTLKRPSRMDRLTTLLVFFSVQITAPLPNIATHIIQSQFIAFFQTYRTGSSSFSILSARGIPNIPSHLTYLIAATVFIVLTFCVHHALRIPIRPQSEDEMFYRS